jgi:deoxyribodipyrimidine photolyase
MWFRRDLRLVDKPALLDAAAGDGGVLPLREALDRHERIRP